MAEPALSIPEPLSEDPEAVATALETAAIFGAQGDAREALRWLRRAAELASDDGQDMRALTLARTAADLSNRLQASSAPPMPSAPPAPSSREAPASGRALRQLPSLERPESNRAAPAADIPPPPPPPPLPHPHQHFKRPARESYAEASSRSDAETEALTTPRRRMTQPGTGPALDLRGGLPPFTAALQPVPEPEPEPELTLPRSDLALPHQEEPTPPPVPAASDEQSPGVLFRQTVRISISPHASQPGSFVVELLEEGEAPAHGREEALLVLLNPHSTLLQDAP